MPFAKALTRFARTAVLTLAVSLAWFASHGLVLAVPPSGTPLPGGAATTDGAIMFPEDRRDDEAVRAQLERVREALRNASARGARATPGEPPGAAPSAGSTHATNRDGPSITSGNALTPRPHKSRSPKRIPGGTWFIAPHGGYEGIEAGTLLSYTVNDLTLGSEARPLLLGYECGRGFLIDAGEMAFEVDEFRCGESGCERIIELHMLVDDGDLHSLKFDSWGYGNDARAHQLADAHGNYPQADDLVEAMLEGRRLFAVVTLYATHATPQVAEFSLADFYLTHLNCP